MNDNFQNQAMNLEENPFAEFVTTAASVEENPFAEFVQPKKGLEIDSRTMHAKPEKLAAEAKQEQPGLASDLWGAFGMGSGQLLSGAGWLFDSETLSNLGDSTTQYWEKTLSDAQRESMGKRFVNEDFSAGDALSDPRSWAGVIVQSLPAMVTGMTGATVATRGAMALGAGKGAAIATGAAAGSAMEGATIAGMVGDETYKTVISAPEEQLSQSPYYQDLITAGADPQSAREKTAQKAAESAALPAGVAGAILGVAFNKFVGDAVTGSLSSRFTKESLKGGVIEGSTEVAQGLAESGSKQVALNEYANQDYDLSEVANEMVAGGGAGFAMGSTVGGLGSLASQQGEQAEPRQSVDSVRQEPYISEDNSQQANIDRLFDENPNLSAGNEEIPTLQADQRVYPEGDIEQNPFAEFVQESANTPSWKKNVAAQNAQMKQTKPDQDASVKAIDDRYTQTKPAEQATSQTNETGVYRVPVDSIQVDPKAYQFRSKVNDKGVDDRLDSVQKWDDRRGGSVLLHRRKDGSVYVADGHHRVNLAKRLGQKEINAQFMDEAEGVSVEDAMTEAAMTNIANDKAEPVDIAKVLRHKGGSLSDHDLPTTKMAKRGEAISKLNDNVFGMTVNGQIADEDAAIIGNNFEQSKQDAAANIFQKIKPATEYQRQLLANEIKAAEFAQSQGDQGGLFGDDPQEVSLMQDRLKVLESLRTRLNTDKKLFSTLNKNAEKASSAGNKIATDANSEITKQSAKSLDLISRVSTTPDLNEMVNRAAKRVYDGEKVSEVSRDLQAEIMSYARPEKSGSQEADAAQEKPRAQSGEPANSGGNADREGERVPDQNATGTDSEGQRSAREPVRGEVTDDGDLLSSYTESELKEKADKLKAQEESDAKTKKAAEDKAKADLAVDDFQLAGSDRKADANPNQNDIFDAENNQSVKVEQWKEGLTEDQNMLRKLKNMRSQGTHPQGRPYLPKELKDLDNRIQSLADKIADNEGPAETQPPAIEEVDAELAKPSVKKQKSSKQARAEDFLKAGKGETVVFSDDIGYAAKGKPYKITQIGKDGSVFIESERGSGTSISYGEISGAINAGTESSVVSSSKTEKPKASGNKVFTDDAAEKARALIKAKLGQLNSGFDPELLQAGITLAGYHIEKGARTFSAYARAMIEDMGESVKPFLKSWYMGVKFDPRGQEFDGMTSSQEVESLSIEDALKQTEANSNAEHSASSQEQDSQADAKPNTKSRVRDEGRGSIRQGANEDSQKAGEAETESSETMGDGRTSSDRKPSNKPLYNGKSRVEGSPAGGADSIGSLPDSTGGLFAEQERDSNAERVIESTPSAHKQLSLKAPSKHVPGDISQIKERMPFLTDGQIEDVVTAEKRFSKPDGFGVMFTNGTGTGKTFTGLGVVKRFVDQGKKNILIVSPKQTIADAWMKAGNKFFGLDINRLVDTQDKGTGIVVTTYANLGQNDAIVTRDWDLVIADESHYLSSDKEGSVTGALKKLRALTLKNESGRDRVYSQYPEMVAEMRAAQSEFEASKGSDDQRVRAAGDKASDKAQAIMKKLKELYIAEDERIAALKPEQKPRAVFLSATPFAYDKNVVIGQEFLFDWGNDRGGSGSKSYNHADNFQDFMMTHFGYRMRYGKLTEPDAKVDKGLMERAFNSWMKKEGALAGRTLDSDFDYDRRFILAESAIGKRVDDAIAWLGGRDIENETDERRELRRELEEIIIGNNFKYHARMYFLEAIKAKEALPNIKEYVEAGYKVLVMHDYKKGGTMNPFRIAPPSDLAGIYGEFKAEFGDLIRAFSSLPSPIELLTSEFPNALVYNGNVSAKIRIGLQDQFNSDEPGSPRLMIAQGDAMREGVSIHDTTGKHKRVLIHLGMPVKPTAAIQQEGRIYRTGQASDAIFRYFTIGSNWERYTFASTISQRASTAENLAMGELARGLKESFIEAYEEAGTWEVGAPDEGKGGKARDLVLSNALTPWDMAKSYYFGTKKQGSGRAAKGREGADYFATPEPLGMKMVQWADIRGGESVLEPSAGHGAIGRFFPENTTNKAIEQSDELASKLSLRFNGDVLTGDFEDHNIINKYDAIVMNPPYGSGGKTAADHVRKALKHLRDGGRVVALIPTGPAADKQFDKLLYPSDPKKDTDAKDVYVVSDITLPRVTFERAGTSVSTRVLVLEKQTDKDLAAKIQQSNRDYSSAETIEEFFDRLETSEIKPRVKLIIEDDAELGEADRVPMSNDAESEAAFTKMDSVHSKKGSDLFVLNMNGDMGDNYDAFNAVAKKHGGFYIRAKMRGYYKPKDGSKTKGKPTFSFETAESRDKFLEEIKDTRKAKEADNGAALYSRSRKFDPADAIPKAELKKVVDAFMNDYNGNIPLDVIIVEKQEDIYGPERTAEKIGRIEGAYHPAFGKVVLVSSSLRDIRTAKRVLRHEVLGHYGLNTFKPEDKRALLERIIQSRKVPGLRSIWKQIDKLYENDTEMQKAEEVFAFVTEQESTVFNRFMDYISEAFRKLLRKAGFFKGIISKKDLQETAKIIAEGIRSGTRDQQTFPKTDSDQFSRREPQGQEPTEHRSRMKKFFEGIKDQPLDRMFRLPFDMTNTLDSHGRLKAGVKLDAATARIIKEWKPNPNGKFAFMDTFIETARHGLIDRYKLSDEYKSTFREAEALGRNIDMQALDILKVLESRGIDAAEVAVLQQMLTGEKIQDHHLNAVAEPILRAIDDLGAMAVEYGVITREQYERNRGSYLHRSYTKHEAEFTGLGKWLLNRQTSSHKRKIQGKASKGRGIEIKIPMHRLLKHAPSDWFGIKMENGKPDLNKLNGMKFIVLENPGVDPNHSGTFEGMEERAHTSAIETIYWPHNKPMPNKYADYRRKGTYEVRGKRKGKVVLWRDYTKAERENMGEILDARYNIAKTFQVISRDIAMGKFFQDVSLNDEWFQRDKPDGPVLSAHEARSLRNLSLTDWVEVPDTTVAKSAGTKHWGALAGGYVRAEIWRDLTELDKMHNPGAWRKVLTQWKLNKTARSPVVHMNNIMSNMMFMDLADVRLTDLIAGIKSYKAKDEHWRAAQEHAAFEGTFANEELRKKVMEPILNEILKQSIDTSADFENKAVSIGKITSAIFSVWKTFDDGMVGMYQIEDEVFRMATYMRRLSLGDTPKEAARIARETFLDYDIRAPWVNAARRTVLPFISYTYRAVPVLYQAILERPWKLAKYTTVAHVAIALSYMLEPGDEDEERRSMRDDQQGYTWLGAPRMARLPTRDDHGNPVFVDVRRWVPAGDIFDVNQGNLALPYLPSWLQFGGPIMLAHEFALNKQAFTGKEITSQTDTPTQKLSKTADWLYKSWMPSAAYIPGSYYYDKVKTAWNGGRDILGRPYSVPQALLSSIGIKIQPHDVKLGLEFKSRDLAAEARLVRAEARRAEMDYDRGIITFAEKTKTLKMAGEKMKVLAEKQQDLMGN